MFKDIIQLICNYLTPGEFYSTKNMYGLSANNYINNTKVNITSLPIDGSHEITHDFILKNVINDEDVIDYALKFDKPEYIKLSRAADKFWITRNTHTERVVPQICEIPNIIIHNYKENGLRLPPNYLDVVFENDCIELMQLVQDYPEKSNISIYEYKNAHNNLWRLNYKHKFAHLIMSNLCMCESIMFYLIMCFAMISFIITTMYFAIKNSSVVLGYVAIGTPFVLDMIFILKCLCRGHIGAKNLPI